MKRFRISVTKVLLACTLSAGVGTVAAAVSAGPSDLMNGYSSPSGVMLLAWTDYKGKPPYQRNLKQPQQNEKGQFARFEEKPGEAMENEQSTQHNLKGNRPPYNRN